MSYSKATMMIWTKISISDLFEFSQKRALTMKTFPTVRVDNVTLFRE